MKSGTLCSKRKPMNRLIDLPPKSVEYMLNDNDIILIDVRREEEWIQTGIIKNSHLLTFFDAYGNHNVITWMNNLNKLITSKETTIILICAHANRTRLIGNYLIQEHDFSNVTHLQGGIALWLQQNRKVIEYKQQK